MIICTIITIIIVTTLLLLLRDLVESRRRQFPGTKIFDKLFMIAVNVCFRANMSKFYITM